MLLPALAMALSGTPALEGTARAPALEQGKPHSHTHAGDESSDEQGPLLLEVTYTSELIGNASGGLQRGTRYLDNLDIVFQADMERLTGWTGATVNIYGLYNNGNSIGDLLGDAQGVNNIETGVRAFRLYEAWIDQKFGENVSLRAGLYDLNSEFDALNASGLFVGSAHGIGTDFSQSGQNGPSIFPSTSLAARLQVTPAEGWAVRAAILDGVPNDPNRPGRTVVRLGNGDGALLVGEVEAPLGGGRLIAGHWRYTARFDRTDGGGTDTGNSGSYIRAEVPLAHRPDGKIDGFMRLGTASGRFNMFDFFASTGLKLTGWIPGRGEDEFGIAVAAALTAEPCRTLTGVGASEIAFEATYRTQLLPWLAVQPNIHYVVNPSADPTVADALVLGIRTEISFDPFNR